MLGFLLKKREHKIIGLIVMVALLIAGMVILFFGGEEESKITNFEECITAGYPIMESYPRQCRTPDGELFMEEIDYPLNPEG